MMNLDLKKMKRNHATCTIPVHTALSYLYCKEFTQSSRQFMGIEHNPCCGFNPCKSSGHFPKLKTQHMHMDHICVKGLYEDLLWALGVEGQGDLAEILDVQGCWFC